MAQNSSVNTNSTILEKKRSPIAISEEVRVLGIEEYEGAAQCLAEAFAIDEVARYFIDTDDMAAYNEEYKYKLHCDILRYVTAAHCYKGLVTTIGPNYDAVALWMPPGQNMDDLWTIFRSGLWRLYFRLSREGKTRFYDEFFPLLHDTKHEVMAERDDDSYYLVYLGSKPSARGKGYAKKLISHMTDRADFEQRATYLESSAHNNLAYYTKFGFEHVKDISMVRGPTPVKLHIMIREPQKLVSEGSATKEGVVEVVEVRA